MERGVLGIQGYSPANYLLDQYLVYDALDRNQEPFFREVNHRIEVINTFWWLVVQLTGASSWGYMFACDHRCDTICDNFHLWYR